MSFLWGGAGIFLYRLVKIFWWCKIFHGGVKYFMKIFHGGTLGKQITSQKSILVCNALVLTSVCGNLISRRLSPGCCFFTILSLFKMLYTYLILYSSCHLVKSGYQLKKSAVACIDSLKVSQVK